MFYILHIIYTLLLFICLNSCSQYNNSNVSFYTLPDTLKVGTIYSPTTFFIYKGDTLGYEFERINNFANSKNIKTKFIISNNLLDMIASLDSGKIDVIAYDVPIINEYKERVIHCGAENITNQVLVQKKSTNKITDVTQLIGKDIYVEKGSKYEIRLNNLDNEIGGGIKIHSISQDSIITEDLIKMVADNKIPLTIVDSDIAKLNKTYYRNIDISLPISFAQRASWAVAINNNSLADSINAWAQSTKSKNESKIILKRYFELSKNEDESYNISKFDFKNGKISQYDHLFKKYAKDIDWDWKLLAAQAWSESRFDTTAVSWAGARGLMQLMPGTARSFGLNSDNIANPEQNIKAAVAYIKSLNTILKKRIPDEHERVKFILAAYNSGIGHILDAISLAKKYGKDYQKWEDNVNITLRWKSNPEYFNDEICKAGYFRGSETVAYVNKVLKYYEYFSKNIETKSN